MKKIWVFIFLITILALSTVGCSQATTTNEDIMPKDGIIRISPSSLFEGDTKKLEPHLGLISGCVKVKYSGPKKYMNTIYEIWEEGKLKKSSGLLLGSLLGKNYDGEVSISLKNEATNDLNPKYRLTVADGNGSSYTLLPEIDMMLDGGRRPLTISKDIEISDDNKIAIWGYADYKGGIVVS
ncbi:hypothetical protein [Desulfitobacterium sp. AusDCA]|uniref:hypothetical protein n=1 Tax=Desulfitobacterium sp. AusDCA TaxID=3240383 RepID=UPI003DA73BF3